MHPCTLRWPIYIFVNDLLNYKTGDPNAQLIRHFKSAKFLLFMVLGIFVSWQLAPTQVTGKQGLTFALMCYLSVILLDIFILIQEYRDFTRFSKKEDVKDLDLEIRLEMYCEIRRDPMVFVISFVMPFMFGSIILGLLVWINGLT